MAVPGRKPKPTSLKLLTGNPGKRALPRDEPQPAPVAPPCPDDLPEEGRRLWEEIGPRLERLGLLTELDGPGLAMLCLHYAVARSAAREMIRDGALEALTRGDRGRVKHPASQVLRDHSAALRAYLAEFGLTPASRARVRTPEPVEEDPLEELRRSVPEPTARWRSGHRVR